MKKVNLPLFIAGKLRASAGGNFSSLITRIAIGSVAAGLAVMILSFAIFLGFRNQVQEKLFSFSAHIKASKFVLGNSYEEVPIATSYDLYQMGSDIPGVASIQRYSRKAGILKTNDEVYGVLIKGIGPDFNAKAFQPNMSAGVLPSFQGDSISTEIVLSRKIADKLLLDVGDEVVVYFVQDPPRLRKLQVAGIYQTWIEDFDDKLVLADHKLIQRINNWADSLVGGFEIFVEDFSKLDDTYEAVYDAMDYDLGIIKVTDSFRQFFDWFVMLNRNVYVFLFVILFVACFNIVSIVLILIMERTNMIGTLKALGATNRQIRGVFVYNGYRIIGKGLLYGNVLGIGLGLLQQHFRLIPLDPKNYYLDAVPIAFNFWVILLLNVLLVVLVSAILTLPTRIISRLEPIRTIKFS